MERLRLTLPASYSPEAVGLREVIKAVARVGSSAHPEIFMHVQPHAHATANLARRFAAACGPNGRGGLPSIAEIDAGAHLHDIGKYFIAPEVLLKSGVLDEEERAVVSLHSSLGAAVISKLPQMTEAI